MSHRLVSGHNLRYLPLLAAVMLLTVIAGIHLLHGSQALTPATGYNPATYAESHLMGYLWSDSLGGTKSSWQSNNASILVNDRFELVARTLQTQRFPNAVVTRTSPTKVTIKNMLLSVPLDQLPAPVQTALVNHDHANLIAFATSVIEGEGNQNGLIIDDPTAAHRNAFISVMQELGVQTGPDVNKPNQGVDAVKADWPTIQCWPFADYSRVPGGPPTAGMCGGSPSPSPTPVPSPSPTPTPSPSPSPSPSPTPPPPSSIGDANGDGRVNGIDFSIVISHDGMNYLPADFNGDGVVGAADTAIMLAHWTW